MRTCVFIVSLCSAVSVISALHLYSTDELSMLYYSDSISHLVRAREILDSSSPGFQQIGTVWLPLPHLILMPISLVDLLFKSGFAGLASSLPSVAITSVILYGIIKTEVKNSWISIVGVCTYLLNPNFVYLGITLWLKHHSCFSSFSLPIIFKNALNFITLQSAV
jgi:hypothetical protein